MRTRAAGSGNSRDTGANVPKAMFSPQDVSLWCCCFPCFLYSMFGCQWEAVGERGRGRALEKQDSWLENTAENPGAYKFIFFSVSPLTGDRQGNGGPDDVVKRSGPHFCFCPCQRHAPQVLLPF